MSTDVRAQVLQATDLVELIGQSVSLKRRGHSFVGLCPFHQEKTPSFHVRPDKQIFYCFGCKAGGTAFDFVMKRDRVEFRDALELLARRAGIEVPQFASTHKSGERQLLLDANSAACAFFQAQLQQPQGQPARDYLAQRGFNADSIRSFQIGFAPDGWDNLLSGPVGRKFGPQALAAAGLAKPRQTGSGFYDTFRNRLMFPIRNEGGQVIAFGGRVMPGSADPAKYLNSPETLLFNKSRSIFGIDLARQNLVESRAAVVVEGYTDVVIVRQGGVGNVVSVLGTALTEQHVSVLRRFVDRIVLLFDADAAGDAAVDRSVALYLTQPVEIAVASLPEALDPDEYLLKHGRQAFEQVVTGAQDALEYAWRQMKKRFASREGDLTGQQKAIEEYLSLLASARGSGPVDSIRWGRALVQVSRLTEIPAEELNRRFRPARAHSRPVRAQGTGPAEPTEGNLPAVPVAPVTAAAERAQRRLLGALLVEPHRWLNVQQELSVDELTGPVRQLADAYWNYQRDEGEPVLNELLAALPEELRALGLELVEEVEALRERESLANLEGMLRDNLAFFEELRQRREAKRLMKQAAEATTELEQVEALRKLQESARRPDLRRFGPG